jgi:hypothetical protein
VCSGGLTRAAMPRGDNPAIQAFKFIRRASQGPDCYKRGLTTGYYALPHEKDTRLGICL